MYEYQVKRRKLNPIRYWAQQIFYNHSYNGYEINLIKEEIYNLARETLVCSFCGITLNYIIGRGKVNNTSSTLDRKDNTLVLDKNNIQILCFSCNSTKRNRSMKDFVKYCETIVQKYSHES